MRSAINPIFHRAGHWAGVLTKLYSHPSKAIFRQYGWIHNFAWHDFSLPAKSNVERNEFNRELFTRIAMCGSEGYVAGSCYAGERQWLHRNVCRL